MSQIQSEQNTEPTLKDILIAVSAIDTRVNTIDVHLNSIDTRLSSVDTKLDSHIADSKQIHEDILSAINTFAGSVEDHFISIENKMVTKDYLDKKMSDQKGDLIKLVRKEDTKVVTLVRNLHNNKVISGQASKRILALEPFPQ